ncbi:MAG: hypothetical protein DRQ13_02615 [Ignavibacteriae bacterium]|nr:MAG: hypothetical protein DRQ13_02615 [Ignavibacteriota bacterium]
MKKKYHQKNKIKGFLLAKYIMIFVLGGMVTYGISSINQNSTMNRGTQNSVDIFANSRAQVIANSMVDKLLMRISDDPTYREARTTEDHLGGKATYIVKDAVFENESLIEITVIAKFKDAKNIIIRYIEKPGERKV